MQAGVRSEYDAFQIMTHHLSHAIDAYCMGAHPIPILHEIHAAHLILKDLAQHAVKEGLVEKIGEFQFFTDYVDSNIERYAFGRKKREGKLGHYHAIGNAIKHADRNGGNDTVLISNQNTFEYLYAVIRDYLSLKSVLVAVGSVEQYAEYANYKPPSVPQKLVGQLSRSFAKAAGMGCDKPSAPQPYIDVACNLFLDWADRVEVMAYRRKGYKKHMRGFSERYPLTIIQRWSLEHHIMMGIAEAASIALKDKFIRRVEHDTARRDFLDRIKEWGRDSSKSYLGGLLQGISSQYSWAGCGYAKKIDDRTVIEDVWSADPEGFDYMADR